MFSDILISLYPWIKSLHLISVISWMAALFYLPRLFVHHAERATVGSEASKIFKMMELKLYKVIMTPAMLATWFFGVLLAATPGVMAGGAGWFAVKFIAVLAMTGFHGWLGKCRKAFENDENTVPGKRYRLMNEVPTVLMIIIVIMVVVKPF